MKPILYLTAFAVTVFVLLTGQDAHAERRSFIRDAEIENTIRDYASPLFKAAGLVPDAVNIYLVNDKSLNAFVMGGQNLFMHTGLITGSDSVGQIIGVIAHEAGHIAGGHLARSREAIENARTKSIIATVLGAAVALGTGRADAGAVIMQGGQISGVQGYLKFSRTQESAADQAALKFLDSTGQSAEGLLEFMNKLRDQELLYEHRQSPYMRTHPLTRDRYLTVEAHLKRSPATGTPIPSRQVATYARIKAKLHAFFEPFSQVLRRYPESDQTLAARYARAIAYYRKPNMTEALKRIDALIAEYPDDPYFHELKGQALFENGRARESLASYGTAVELMPASSLLRRDFARVQIETGDDTLLDGAIEHLQGAVERDPSDTFAWHQLAIAYGRRGEMPLYSLALAEEAVRQGRKSAALHHAGKAQQSFPHGSRNWLHAQDIIEAANLLDSRR